MRIYTNELLKNIGKTVTIQGWVDSKRDHGKVVFVDLRDRYSKVQTVGVGKMNDLGTEDVIEITGLVKERPAKLVNEELLNGSIEIEVEDYKILNKCKELPIPIDDAGYSIKEEIRLKYRYLDLRRERMRGILTLRSKFFNEIRKNILEHSFVEVETPMLTKATKEGARDFIVPSRHNSGKFYALPQSPQQYKQLLMTAGVERYFQFARCIRDEDLRADRGYEFTQLDLEMSFVDEKTVMATVEDIVKKSVKAMGKTLKHEEFPIFSYEEAMEQFGADKFDLRTDEEKEAGVISFAWVNKFPFFKKVDKDDAAEVLDGKSGWTFTHNPFSSPTSECINDHLAQKNIESIITNQYDLVCNGYEAGGGSIRAHQAEVLEATFKIMGYSDEQIQDNVGHMLEAFKLGTPPHGGIALGLDRLVMILAGESSLKEVIAFPMTSTGKTAVMDAPSDVEDKLLNELQLKVTS
jgi:aspartyl-tRNA synthetase